MFLLAPTNTKHITFSLLPIFPPPFPPSTYAWENFSLFLHTFFFARLADADVESSSHMLSRENEEGRTKKTPKIFVLYANKSETRFTVLQHQLVKASTYFRICHHHHLPIGRETIPMHYTCTTFFLGKHRRDYDFFPQLFREKKHWDRTQLLLPLFLFENLLFVVIHSPLFTRARNP